ncbi:hypothetical protein PR048_027519 [Dryococelus australis]|uniref:DNA-directed RNA polymerase RBP11-like dimerisation domain-containing protein n=1 Tax=Dryococelus australis TaxID=614101 RepID=A0ABQ9GGR4_9NEOP|nr:hypothetical protein PR048_027519 [Dryococelus australis]
MYSCESCNNSGFYHIVVTTKLQNADFIVVETVFGVVLDSPEVVLCGYTVPHPSQTDMHFRIQSTGPRAVDILRRGIEDLEKLCDHTLATFQVCINQFLAASCNITVKWWNLVTNF